MPRKPKVLSIKELRRELAARERQLDQLLARREKLLARLEAVDAEISAIGADVPSTRAKRKTTPKKAPPGKRARKRAGGRPLVEFIVDVLKKARQGIRVKDVMAAVAEAGYVSSSKDFYGIVAAALRDDKRFKKLSRGVYTLA